MTEAASGRTGGRGAQSPAGGVLYLVASPIGNLEDVSLRGLRLLSQADVLACEDTRVSRKLFARHGISRPPVVIAYHGHNERRAGERILRHLRAGRSVALLTDAGTPGVSDPGYRLVCAAVEAGVRVEPVPGPCALVAALAVSGLPTGSFTFKGFPPRKPGKLRAFLETDAGAPHTLVFYESPHRLARFLAAALEVLGDRRAAVCLELTKKFERVERGMLAHLAARCAADPPRGEATVVIAGAE